MKNKIIFKNKRWIDLVKAVVLSKKKCLASVLTTKWYRLKTVTILRIIRYSPYFFLLELRERHSLYSGSSKRCIKMMESGSQVFSTPWFSSISLTDCHRQENMDDFLLYPWRHINILKTGVAPSSLYAFYQSQQSDRVYMHKDKKEEKQKQK